MLTAQFFDGMPKSNEMVFTEMWIETICQQIFDCSTHLLHIIIYSVRIVIASSDLFFLLLRVFSSSGELKSTAVIACNGYFGNSEKGNESRVCASIEETSVMQTLHITHIVRCIDYYYLFIQQQFQQFPSSHFVRIQIFEKYLPFRFLFFFVRIAFANLVFILLAFFSHLSVSEVK